MQNNQIEELENEIKRLKAQLQPYLERDARERRHAHIKQQIRKLIKIESEGWREPSNITYEESENGDIVANYKYYAGCNEYDYDSITLPKEWIDVNDLDAVYKAHKLKQEEEEKIAEQEAERQAKIERLVWMKEEIEELVKELGEQND